MDSILNIASFVQTNEFDVSIVVSYDDGKGNIVYPEGAELEKSNIIEVQLFNKMNEFLQTGSVTYVDDRQIIDKLLGRTLCYLYIDVQQVIRPKGQDSLSLLEEKRHLYQRYLVDSVNIVSRDKEKIVYTIGLVDENYLDLTRNISYSTMTKNGKNPLNIGEILKELFKKANLKVAKDTLSGIGSSLTYITKTNDNLMTAFRFLMRRDFYLENGRSEALNIILQNTNRGEYGIYNLLEPLVSWIDDKRYEVENGVNFSMFTRENLEVIASRTEKENGIQTLNLKGRTQVLDSLHNVIVNTYDQESNSFGQYRINTQDITNFVGNSKGDGFQKRYENAKDILGKTHFRECPEWNNTMNVYEDQIDNILNFDSVVVVTDGSANRIPGMDFAIFINTPNVGSRDMGNPAMSEAQKINNLKFERFNGAWTISSVRHVIRPAEGRFEDTICLFRNKN